MKNPSLVGLFEKLKRMEPFKECSCLYARGMVFAHFHSVINPYICPLEDSDILSIKRSTECLHPEETYWIV